MGVRRPSQGGNTAGGEATTGVPSLLSGSGSGKGARRGRAGGTPLGIRTPADAISVPGAGGSKSGSPFSGPAGGEAPPPVLVLDLPDSVHAMVMARVDALSADALLTLKVVRQINIYVCMYM